MTDWRSERHGKLHLPDLRREQLGAWLLHPVWHAAGVVPAGIWGGPAFDPDDERTLDLPHRGGATPVSPGGLRVRGRRFVLCATLFGRGWTRLPVYCQCFHGVRNRSGGFGFHDHSVDFGRKNHPGPSFVGVALGRPVLSRGA